jgi:hypothetical protein
LLLTALRCIGVSIMAVACGGMRRYGAVRLFPLVVIKSKKAAEEDEETEMAIYLIFKI